MLHWPKRQIHGLTVGGDHFPGLVVPPTGNAGGAAVPATQARFWVGFTSKVGSSLFFSVSSDIRLRICGEVAVCRFWRAWKTNQLGRMLLVD